MKNKLQLKIKKQKESLEGKKHNRNKKQGNQTQLKILLTIKLLLEKEYFDVICFKIILFLDKLYVLTCIFYVVVFIEWFIEYCDNMV